MGKDNLSGPSGGSGSFTNRTSGPGRFGGSQQGGRGGMQQTYTGTSSGGGYALPNPTGWGNTAGYTGTFPSYQNTATAYPQSTIATAPTYPPATIAAAPTYPSSTMAPPPPPPPMTNGSVSTASTQPPPPPQQPYYQQAGSYPAFYK